VRKGSWGGGEVAVRESGGGGDGGEQGKWELEEMVAAEGTASRAWDEEGAELWRGVETGGSGQGRLSSGLI
jgi:hypothetical protein